MAATGRDGEFGAVNSSHLEGPGGAGPTSTPATSAVPWIPVAGAAAGWGARWRRRNRDREFGLRRRPTAHALRTLAAL